MKYLCVQNAGEADVKDMTLLGLSTSRGNQDRIGQFGTGFIQGVLTCIRHGVTPVVYVGSDRLTFHIEGDKDEVVFKFKGRKYRLNVCIGFGEIDWTDVKMGIREFISNAIDADSGWTDQTVTTSNGMRGQPGITRVFLPYAPFADYHRNLSRYFLHSIGKENQRILFKEKPCECRVFRKGVFVCEVQDSLSLFDYNFGDEMGVDECRNLSTYMAAHYARKAIRGTDDHRVIDMILDAVVDNMNYAEVSSADYARYHDWNKAWSERWSRHRGNLHVCSEVMLPYISRKTKDAVVIGSPEWLQILIKHLGAKDASIVLDPIERDGGEVLPASQEAESTVGKAWAAMERLKLTGGRTRPTVRMFRKLDENGSSIHGYYMDNCVYLREDNQSNLYVALHELAHHITGADDDTHDFTSFAFRVATAAIWGASA